MELNDVFMKRRSIRKFKDIEISQEIINEILKNASLAPETDSCNYYFGVVTDPTIRSKLAKATLWADWIAQAPVIFVCCGDISYDIKDLKDDDYGMIGSKLRYSEEVVNFLKENRNRKACKTLLLASPVYIAAQHMILSAVSHELRGCLVDFMDIEKINEVLGLPDHITCQVLVPVGYADEEPKPKTRTDIHERVFLNSWKNRLK